jgi:hypothetical protein
MRYEGLINKIQNLRVSAVAIQNHFGGRITLCVRIDVLIYEAQRFLEAIDQIFMAI